MNLNQVTVHSNNLNRSVQFYQKLGLKLIVDSRPRYVRFECPTGESTFSISQAENVSPSSIVLYFEVDNVDKVYRQLKLQDIEFSTKPCDQSWLWREAVLQDPDGHNIKIFTAGHNRKNPPWRVGKIS